MTMTQPFTDLKRLSLNQATTNRWSLQEAADGCARAGIPWIDVWRDKLAAVGTSQAARIVRDAGLRVSGLCRGGMFPAATAEERRARIDDTRRAIDEAATLETDALVLVCGAAPDRDIAGARAMVADAIGQLIPHARASGVRLAIEPLHPMFAAERSVITLLGEALDLAEQFDTPEVGVIIDAYHVWWDPYLYQQIRRSQGRIVGFHVSDWTIPTPHMLLGRGMMGDGVIELRRIRAAVDEAGYDGPIEVEIFNQAIWDSPGDDVLRQMCARYLEYV
jgi:sugar phosphate isomerase/epimerase